MATPLRDIVDASVTIVEQAGMIAALRARIEELEAENKSLLAREMLAQGRLNELRPVLRNQEKRITRLERERERLRSQLDELAIAITEEQRQGAILHIPCPVCDGWLIDNGHFTDCTLAVATPKHAALEE